MEPFVLNKVDMPNAVNSRKTIMSTRVKVEFYSKNVDRRVNYMYEVNIGGNSSAV